jgi:excisionase family DNA binding protein
MTTTQEKLNTFEEVRARLKTSERSLRRWIAAGQIEVLHVGRQIRVEEKELKRYLDARRRARQKK